jgi:Holliday junction DNA helicase RuvA
MLHSLNGILLDCEEDFAVIDCHGVRFQCEIPGSTAKQLPPAGSPVTLRTRMSFNPNDNAFALFGFATPMEADCFDVLTSMSGIGPRKALGILSQIEVGAFAAAIVGRDMAYVSKIKGVGQKTAERLIVELREKMIPFAGAAPSAPRAVSRPENVADAIEALVALGVKPITAEAAIDRAVGVLGKDARTEELVREGLRHR